MYEAKILILSCYLYAVVTANVTQYMWRFARFGNKRQNTLREVLLLVKMKE